MKKKDKRQREMNRKMFCIALSALLGVLSLIVGCGTTAPAVEAVSEEASPGREKETPGEAAESREKEPPGEATEERDTGYRDTRNWSHYTELWVPHWNSDQSADADSADLLQLPWLTEWKKVDNSAYFQNPLPYSVEIRDDGAVVYVIQCGSGSGMARAVWNSADAGFSYEEITVDEMGYRYLELSHASIDESGGFHGDITVQLRRYESPGKHLHYSGEWYRGELNEELGTGSGIAFRSISGRLGNTERWDLSGQESDQDSEEGNTEERAINTLYNQLLQEFRRVSEQSAADEAAISVPAALRAYRSDASNEKVSGEGETPNPFHPDSWYFYALPETWRNRVYPPEYREAAVTIPFFDIDQHARRAPRGVSQDFQTLAEWLIEPARNDLEKTRAIFRWITNNIVYDVNAYRSGRYGDNSAEGVLRSRRAVCAGYAGLFTALGKAAGLEVVTVNGFGKGAGYRHGQSTANSNHAWNAVKLDDVWHLIDSTWGTGHVSGERFVRELNNFWFMTPPELFIFSHRPSDSFWQLLEEPVSRADFERMNRIRFFCEINNFPYLSVDEIIAAETLPGVPRFYKINHPVYFLQVPATREELISGQQVIAVVIPEASSVAAIKSGVWNHFTRRNGLWFVTAGTPRRDYQVTYSLHGPRSRHLSIMRY